MSIGKQGNRARAGAGALLAVALALVALGAQPAAAAPPCFSPASFSGGSCRYSATGQEQTYTVPAGVTAVAITAVGAPGSSGASGGSGGAGALVGATVPVTPGSTLYVEVGSGGGPAAGGHGGAGGGASDVRTCSINASCSGDSRLVVAGGGGGGAAVCPTRGGSAGDGTTTGPGAGGAGGDTSCSAGQGGNGGLDGTAGGSGGSGSTLFATEGGGPGMLGPGGAASTLDPNNGAGGGGGGYYGGGAGGDGLTTNGGGPGSGGAGSSHWVSNASHTSMAIDTSGTPEIVIAAPTATINSPANGGTYALGQSVSTSFSCADSSGGPGLSVCTDSNAASGSTDQGSGSTGTGLLDTAAAGPHTYFLTAVSRDGATVTTSLSYTVNAPPQVHILTPGDGSVFVVGDKVATKFVCSAGTPGVLITSCTDSGGATGSGDTGAGSTGHGTLNTTKAGSYTYTVTARALDGQTASQTIRYVVKPQPVTGPPKRASAHLGALGPKIAVKRGCHAELARVAMAAKRAHRPSKKSVKPTCISAWVTLAGLIDPRADHQQVTVVLSTVVSHNTFSMIVYRRVSGGRVTARILIPAQDTDAGSEKHEHGGVRWTYQLLYGGSSRLLPATSGGHFSVEAEAAH